MTDVRIVTEPLGGSPLSRAVQGAAAPARWLAARPRSAEAWRALAQARAAESGWHERWEALRPAIMATGPAAERLARVVRDGGVVVTTGQQPGLFGGPIYTWSKAVSALALADAIQERTGVATAAIYWAATDDADFAEAASTAIARPGGLEVLRADQAPPTGTPLALTPLGDLEAARHRLLEASGSAPDPRALETVGTAYGDPTRTHGDAFVALLRALLAPLGVPVLDASHEAAVKASAPTIRLALDRASAIEAALTNRASEIRAAGFEPQVDDVRGLALAFVRDATIKRRLTIAEASGVTGWLTPNVLLRPIVERAILPTLAYVAGPGELAYFAQVGAVADAMGVSAPVAVPRWSCTLIEPQTEAVLTRLGVTPADLDPPNALEGRLARAAMSETTARTLADLREVIAMLPDTIGEESEALGVGGAVVGATKGLHHRVDRLERRIVAALKRRESARMTDLATLRAALRPRGARQERTLNIIPLLARNGCELLTDMCRAAGPHAAALVAGESI
ncbi:MAG: bacillithiol biosynthesis BshC [Gemmatimonadaceae bacterium]|nr:bacillithiol biosynthesis BshC [Gemmatimonadaceae bacterium]